MVNEERSHWQESHQNDMRELHRRVDAELIPKIKGTDAVITLVPTGETDVKFAIELGLAVFFDKPIILLVRPGQKLSGKLASLADELVEANFNSPTMINEGIQAAIKRLVTKGKMR